ncbi:MAG: tRNA pseudouridine(55) synthase TruB [Clostridiales Family XIII bacterium]|jgi:tRNA pseudouridine55 synthase|nr:tRNA pseudouridine(55) synthase TruB [Clostridiales Family XIII bacterium]
MTLSSTHFTDGIIVFFKPQGMTSHDAVGFVRRLTGIRRVGHTGTLDPMAEGVLPICVGGATRLIEFMDAGKPDAKAYECEMRLGVTTDTLDVWGETVSVADGADFRDMAAPARVREIFASLVGDIRQIPPAYSAIKYNGKKLYEYARGGEDIPKEALRPRDVHIDSMDVQGVAMDEEGRDVATVGFATVRFSVVCSSGTYVRSIVRDVGESLGCGAAMSALTRTKSGTFTLSDAHTKEALKRAADDDALPKLMLPPDAGVPFMPFIRLGETACRKFVNGVAIRISADMELPSGVPIRVYGEDSFIGVGICVSGEIKPCKVIFA